VAALGAEHHVVMSPSGNFAEIGIRVQPGHVPGIFCSSSLFEALVVSASAGALGDYRSGSRFSLPVFQALGHAHSIYPRPVMLAFGLRLRHRPDVAGYMPATRQRILIRAWLSSAN